MACVGNSIMGSRQMFRRGVLSDIFNEASLNNVCVYRRRFVNGQKCKRFVWLMFFLSEDKISAFAPSIKRMPPFCIESLKKMDAVFRLHTAQCVTLRGFPEAKSLPLSTKRRCKMLPYQSKNGN